MQKKKQDTKLESVGAEFLVLGLLLVEGIHAYKAYINFPGYDLTAINPVTRKIARIQVKSRWATDYNRSFPLKNLECDFVIHVALNRGYRYSKKSQPSESGIKSPDVYIFPLKVLSDVRKNNDWKMVLLKDIEDMDFYKENWSLIRKFLSPVGARVPRVPL